MAALTFHALPDLVQVRDGARPAGTLDERLWNLQLDVWMEAGADAAPMFNACHEAGVSAGFIPRTLTYRAARDTWAAVPEHAA